LPEPFPIVALALTALVEILPNKLDGVVVVQSQTWQVSMYAKVIEVSAQFCVERFEQIGQIAMAVLLTP
jgi:hypothetical protein